MADAVAQQNGGGGGVAGQQQQQQRPTAWQVFQSIASRMLIMYLVMQGMNYFRGKPNSNIAVNQTDTSGSGGGQTGVYAANMFEKGSKFVIYLTIMLILIEQHI